MSDVCVTGDAFARERAVPRDALTRRIAAAYIQLAEVRAQLQADPRSKRLLTDERNLVDSIVVLDTQIAARRLRGNLALAKKERDVIRKQGKPTDAIDKEIAEMERKLAALSDTQWNPPKPERRR